MKHITLTWQDVQDQVSDILHQMQQDQWRPDYVVGITRGGLVPANLISQRLDCGMRTLQIQLRDGDASGCESNLWMPDDAVGSAETTQQRILVVDDINDTGATMNWLQQDWQSSCPHSDWGKIWNHNVRFAVLYDNLASNSTLKADYVGRHIDKSIDHCWIVFPWEQWWNQKHKN